MDAQAVRRRALIAALSLTFGAATAAATAAQDTSFLSAEELGQRLVSNVVRVRGIREHGFGMVVGASAGQVYVATARHVVGAANDGRIDVVFCAGDDGAGALREAVRVDGFDAGAQDVSLLRVPQPRGYALHTRSLADEASIVARQETWLLGQEQQCGMTPRGGAIAALRDERDNLRIEFPGVRGGASGGPVISGYGVVGLVTDAGDLTFTAFSVAALAAKVNAQLPGVWQLERARNIPPTDPRAAEVDLAEMLNLYLFSVRNLQGLLLQPVVPQQLFFDFSRDYNTAVNRFRDARDRYDGTLSRDWPPAVLPMWVVLREQLWQVHQTFWRMNAGDSKAIFEQKKAPAAVQAQMRALEPDLHALQAGTSAFLAQLGQRSKP